MLSVAGLTVPLISKVTWADDPTPTVEGLTEAETVGACAKLLLANAKIAKAAPADALLIVGSIDMFDPSLKSLGQ